METQGNFKVAPTIGEGIYTKRDVADILKLSYNKVSQWMDEFWGEYTFGIKGNKFVNFKTLIEFYTFYHLRDNGYSSQKIKKFHANIARDLNTPYPFAQKIHIIKDDENEKGNNHKYIYYERFDNLIKADNKRQFDIKTLLIPFLKKIEFNEEEIAERFFPLDNSKRVVVDPKFQFGQPVITGTRIKIELINDFYKGGESKENICKIYNLQIAQVDDAILYYQRSA